MTQFPQFHVVSIIALVICDLEYLFFMLKRFHPVPVPGLLTNRLNIKVGLIKHCTPHPNADKLYISQVDIGDSSLQVVSGLVNHIPLNKMLDKRVVVIENMKNSNFKGIKSFAMLLAAFDENTVQLINPPLSSPVGDKLCFGPFTPLYNKSSIKDWKPYAEKLSVNSQGVVTFTDGEIAHPLMNESGDFAKSDSLVDCKVG